jgi:hypothetical protein
METDDEEDGTAGGFHADEVKRHNQDKHKDNREKNVSNISIARSCNSHGSFYTTYAYVTI